MVLRCSSQIRIAGMGGVIGFEQPALMGMGKALGADPFALAWLLPFVEAGMVKARNKKTEQP